MPDALKKTISASQVAGLFGVSPYETPRTLYDNFHDNIDPPERENESMRWGKVVQAHICGRVQDTLNLEVVPNAADVYERHRDYKLGCTKDAHLTCPTRGYGVVEAKALRWQIFKEDWTATTAPLHIELQVQAQMLVTGASWGVIAAMVGANEDFILYERRPDERVFKRLVEESERFFADVANNNQPPVLGNKIELEGLAHLFPTVVPAKKIEDMLNVQYAQLARDYQTAKDLKSFHEKAAEGLKARLLDVTRDAQLLRVHGSLVKVRKTPIQPSLVMLPAELRSGLMLALGLVGEGRGPIPIDTADAAAEAIGTKRAIDAINAAINWTHTVRKGYVQTVVDVEEKPDGDMPVEEDRGSFLNA